MDQGLLDFTLKQTVSIELGNFVRGGRLSATGTAEPVFFRKTRNYSFFRHKRILRPVAKFAAKVASEENNGCCDNTEC